MKLRVSEIFTSIQGEGTWLGVPSTFVRVSGCNMRCVWCDTPYASWQPEGPTMEVAEIVRKVRDAGVEHVVVTGGEPMLFPATAELCAALKAHGHIITIETAGTVFQQLECDLMSISPKLANSTPRSGRFEGALPEGETQRVIADLSEDWIKRHEDTRLNRQPIKQLVQHYNTQLKFVVAAHADFEEIDTLVAEVGVPPSRVLIMAEGTNSETLRARSRDWVTEVIRRGWRLTPRWHVDLFGNTKGT